jgi:hypothetical protein
MATDNQGFPIVNQPFVDAGLNITSAWRQLLVTLWNRTGASGGGGIGTLLVNPGTGTNQRELNVALSDYANVNDFLDTGDVNYDGAFVRALAAKDHAYVPAVPWIADPDNFYHTTTTIILESGKSIIGDGAGVSKIVCDTAAVPVVTLWHNIFWFGLQDLTIAHTVPTAVGGDGLFQGQGLTDWVDNGLVSNVLFAGNYHGCNLGKAFACHFRDSYALGNAQVGFKFTTTGNSDVFGTPTGGPVQWILTNCGSQANGYDGYSYSVTGTAFGGAGVGSSMGTLINCVTFANGHHGVSVIGTALQPLQSIRLEGGFFGNDAGDLIYLDTYGNNHVVSPQFCELAGNSNIYLTSNNDAVIIKLSHCTGAWFDGITSVGATDVMITGGNFVNNGLRGSGGIGLTWAGIRIDGGSAQINSIRAKDSGAGIQNFGISVTGDNVIIAGSRLTNNASAPVVWTTGPTNSVVMGCLPNSINIGNFGTITAATITATTDLIASTAFHSNGASAFTGAGGITVTQGGMTFTTGVVGNGITVDNIRVNFSIGMNTAPTGLAGRIDMTGALTGATTLSCSGQITTSAGNIICTAGSITALGGNIAGFNVSAISAMAAATITASSDLVANSQFHSNGAGAAFSSGIFCTAGGINMTAIPGNGIVAGNAAFSGSVGIGRPAPAAAGTLDVSANVQQNGVNYTFP